MAGGYRHLLRRRDERNRTFGHCAATLRRTDTWGMVATSPLSQRRLRWWSVAATTAALLAIAPSVVAAPNDVTSYDVPSGKVRGIAVAPDGQIWFTLPAAGIVGRLDPATGAVHETALEPTSDPSAITVGADGSVWFTLQTGNAIGRLVPAGDLVVYTLPNDESGPAGIAAAADGSVWFTEAFTNRIGRITVDGTLSEWPTGTLSGPQGIAVGADGTVWFSAQSGKLGAFDPTTEAFSSVEFASTSQPAGVAIDPDGDVWVSLRRAGSVARYTPGTDAPETIALTPDGNPSGIVAGPDGGIWVAQTAAGSLARVDLETEDVTTIDLGPFSPQNVASDPSGFVWVSEPMANRVSSVEVEIRRDTTPPTIDLRSPLDGNWTAPGVPLVANYRCADEGGSRLASCAAPVTSGDTLPMAGPGAHTFTVAAADGAGNTASASGSYLEFTSVSGAALGGTGRSGAGLTLSLGMGLLPKADPGIAATSTQVDCGTGAAIGAPEPAELRDRVANRGSLELRWLTSRTWDGTCRALTVAFSATGWQGARATFGIVAFGGVAAKR
jgi:virginiamycin B lyase